MTQAASWRVLVVALLVMATPSQAHACVWFFWDYFSPLPPCPVYDATQNKNNLLGAGLALAAKLPTYVRRYHEVKKEVVAWQLASKDSRKFMEHVHYYVGAIDEQLPDPLPSLVAEFNRQDGRLKYVLDSKTNSYTGVNPDALVNMARATLRTEAGVIKGLALNEFKYQSSDYLVGLMSNMAFDAAKAGVDFDTVTAKVTAIRKYAATLDGVVSARKDTKGGAEASKGLFIARLAELQAGQLASLQAIDHMRRDATRSAVMLRKSGEKMNGNLTSLRITR